MLDLVLATADRTRELPVLLDSLRRQTYQGFRLIVVDQNEDDRVGELLAEHRPDAVHLRSARGLSRARNIGLQHLLGEVVAFPDDDCAYPADLLERVALRFSAAPTLDGITGRAVGRDGRSSPSWKTDAARLTDDNLWNRAISFAIFLRRALITAVGEFDPRLGLGAGTPWSSGEETDYLVRAVRSGALIEYDPELIVIHDEKPLTRSGFHARGFREGASVGYILRKHHYPARVTARMLVRPVGGAALSLARLNTSGAAFHAATLRGRILGLRHERGRERPK